jgi:large subunit ribosomal protein L10
MSKRVKSLIERELQGRLKDVEAVAVISPRGIDGHKNNAIRRKLRQQGLRMVVVKNTIARRATGQSRIQGFDKLLDGPSAVIYGKASISIVARMLLDEKKADDKIELRGIFFDGEIYAGSAGVEQVSKLPTREEAIGSIVAALLGPGAKLAGALKGPGGTLGAVLKSIEERAKEREGAAPAAEDSAVPPAAAGAAS